MSLYVFNNQQKVTKVIKYKRLVEATQEIELNGTDELTVEIPNKDWNKLEEEPLYLAVRDTSKRFSFHMYKILQEDTQDDTVTVKGIQIGYDEMKAYGYIKDRRFTQASMQSVANVIVEGTDWQTGFVDSDLPAITTNFYYISRLEAIRKVIEANGCEIRFRVEITGNKIVAKRIDFLKRMSSDKGKRFSYGSKLLSVVKEKDSAELYTALVGRGKGEEVGDGYGRRIGFEDIEWNVANGDPVDKPLGQEFVELPDMTALYGYPDGEPRTNVVTFEDTEDEALLLEQTYEKLVEVSRPQVQFKATVQLIGDAELGETVSIIRHDLNFKYKTRIFKVKRDLLNNNRTEIELGDRITETLGRTIRRIDTTNQRREERIVEYVQNTADGKNKIFRQASTPDTGMTVNDLWYKPVGEGETELYRWNGNIWQLEKVSAGLLGGTLDAENGDVNLINVNVANIVGETSEFVQSYWNAINNQVSINGNRIRIDGPDSFSEIRDGAFISDDVVGTRMMLSNGRIVAYDRRQTDNWGTLFHLGANRSTRTPFTGGMLGITHREDFTIGRYWALGSAESTGITEYLKFNYSGERVESNGRITALKQLNAHESIQLVGTDSMLTFPGGQLRGNSDSQNAAIEAVNDFTIWARGERKLVASTNLVMRAALDTNGYAVIGNSDVRLKDNIQRLKTDDLSIIKKIDYVSFDWKNGGRHDIGFIAQQMQEIAPHLISENEDGYLNYILQEYTHTIGHGLQQLAFEHDSVAQTVDGHADTIHKLQQELSKANRRIEELEGGNSDD